MFLRIEGRGGKLEWKREQEHEEEGQEREKSGEKWGVSLNSE